MPKKVLVLSLLLLIFTFSAFAQEESYITTYYPSPYGSYNELQTNKMAVGDTAGQPPENGQLYTARSAIYKQVNKDILPNPQKGELIYNADGKFWYYDGVWKKVGGSVVLVGPLLLWQGYSCDDDGNCITGPLSITIPPEAYQVICAAPGLYSGYYPQVTGYVRYNGVNKIAINSTSAQSVPYGPASAWNADGGGQVTLYLPPKIMFGSWQGEGKCYYTKLE